MSFPLWEVTLPQAVVKHKSSSDLSSLAQLEDLPGVKEAEQHEESVRVRAGSGMRPAALGSLVCKLRKLLGTFPAWTRM